MKEDKESNSSASRSSMPMRRKGAIETRRTDWRFGPVVYQVIVDRFAPSNRLDSKRDLYKSPRQLRDWREPPERGRYLHEEGNLEGELEFYGGDLESLRQRLEYLHELGAEVLYLNPIFHAFTNHKYDTLDYSEIDPQYGDLEDLKELSKAVSGRGMRLILDGVFNHVGRRSPLFQKALSDGDSPERRYFTFSEKYPHGYLSWRNSPNLPELNLENPEVRAMLWDSEESVVQRYVREVGIDGWRLDVAPDLGFQILEEITRATHDARSDSVVIGECWNYPEEWLRVVDGVLNFHAGTLILEFIRGKIGVDLFSRSMERMIDDGGIEGILRSHLVLDNHDTPRLATLLPSGIDRHLARVLQFTIPGCPVVYYGSELGMTGGKDINGRGPMRWDWATDDNPDLAFVRRLIRIRRENPALRFGDFRMLESSNAAAFLRTTDRTRESIVVLVNASDREALEIIPIRDSRLMDAAPLECLLSGEQAMVGSGLLEVRVPAHSARMFRTVDRGDKPGYSMFKRV